jgi:Tfp pilus assembly protein PilF
MFIKKIKFLFILALFYQSPIHSKSTSFENFDTKNFSKYFSGIVAFENKNNSQALDFFNSSKVLLNKHEPFLQKYISTLVLENKILQAISVVKQKKNNSVFFESYLLHIIDNLKKDNLDTAYDYLGDALNLEGLDNFESAILENLKQYIFLFKEQEILKEKKQFGKLSLISEAFQRCYLEDVKTDTYFLNLINNNELNYTRYIYFYLSYLIENNRIGEAKKIIQDIDYVDSTLLLSQSRSLIENNNEKKIVNFFSCKNQNDLIGEFLFIISNLYSSQDNFEKSNFYLNLSNFLNPKFIFNLSLATENYFLNKEYKKTKKILKNFTKEYNFYHWYRIKKEAQIINRLKNEKEASDFISSEFNKIKNPNLKFVFDLANFYKNSKNYDKAIKYYTKVIDSLGVNSKILSNVYYRRGASYERIKNYKDSDKDFLQSLRINPDDAHVLNYLAYSWLERDYKVDEAIKMLEKAYETKSNDPYIIDSIGWAYYLTNDFLKAEKFLKRAVELMPDDPIVNDHYGDTLWKLGRKIQARYFWDSVLKMDSANEEIIEKINSKMTYGPKNL